MQYRFSAAALAFALGAAARPQWGEWPGQWQGHHHSMPAAPADYNTPSAPGASHSYRIPSSDGGPIGSSGVPSGSAPSGTAPYYPTGTGGYSSVGPTGGASSYPAPSGGASSAAASSGGVSPYAAPPRGASSVTYGSGIAASSVIVDPVSGAASEAPAPSTTATGSSGSGSSGGGLPASSGTSVLSATQTIAAGASFDCGMVAYDRGVSCTGDEEGGDEDAVFIMEPNSSLSNCIIGPNQIEGVHCGCKLTNVWWSAVCEDAFSIKEQEAGETTTITGGGAFGADDKVLQHNGGGTLSVSGFTVDTFGKVYRSCGNCDEMRERHVIMDDITATGGSQIAGINSNYGDTATLTNIKVSDVEDICVTYTGNDTGEEPEENGSGPSENCIYELSDVTEI
ncbi:hypothetical protein LTR37_019223 [Vermiconidia calcicola]|uniref:Uncharacterized protein n=1 Tax=Vermiconidia calcicola TaxID=1690605 RepID=A0ACC3MHQ5_9PEZI|nr:hypothetical protein LTR37_019223 [Vermiconidia calcicola]